MSERAGSFEVVDLGRTRYADAVALQTRLCDAVIAGDTPDTLLLTEHEPVITLGAGFHAENLLLSEPDYAARGIEIHPTDRGGDVTYHGPGQLIAWPVFDVQRRGRDLHRWLRGLEEAVIIAIAEIGVEGQRLEVNSGVWVGDQKVCAMGIKIRRWVSQHGLALNCNVDLAAFSTIVPCGISTHGVTSLSRAAGREISIETMKTPLVRAFETVFNPRAMTKDGAPF